MSALPTFDHIEEELSAMLSIPDEELTEEQKKVACEAAGLKAKASDIAADGVGRRALEALPELLAELKKERASHRNTMEASWHYAKMWARAELANEDLIECVSTLNELVDCLSTWLANAYIDPCLLPDIGRNDIEPPQPEDVIAYANECAHGLSL